MRVKSIGDVMDKEEFMKVSAMGPTMKQIEALPRFLIQMIKGGD